MLAELKEVTHNHLLSMIYCFKLKLSLGSINLGHKPFQISTASISSDVLIITLTWILTKGDMQAVTSAKATQKPFPFPWSVRMWGIIKKKKLQRMRSTQVIWQLKFIKQRRILTTSRMKISSSKVNLIYFPNNSQEWKLKNNRL